ncbi:MAG: MFS transporter [Anaerolineaceae bacterium]
MIGRDIRQLQSKHPEFVARMESYYRWNFIALAFDSSIYAFAVAALSQDTIIPYFVEQLTDKSWIIGLVPAIYYFGFFLPQLIGAYLVNGRRTKKNFVLKVAITERFGVLLVAIVAQIFGLFSNTLILILLLVAYMIFSVTNGMISPGYSDFISKSIVKNRGFFYGFTNGLGGIIGFGSSLFSHYLLDNYAFPFNLRILFWTALATSVISPIIIASFKEEPYPEQVKPEPLGTFIRTIPKHIKHNPDFSRFMISRAVLGLGVLGNAYFALYSRRTLSLPDGSLAIFNMIILITQSVLGFLWGWIGDRFGCKVVYVIVSLFVVLQGVFGVWAKAPWMFYSIAFFIGGVYASIRICDPNMIFEIAPTSETGRYIGINNTLVGPVMTMAPLIGGLLVDLFSHQVLFYSVIIVGVISALLVISLMPHIHRENS